MKTQLSKLVLGLAFLSPVLGLAQEAKIQPCNTYAAMEAYFAANPGAKQKYEAAQENLRMAAEANGQAHANGKLAATEYTIPVVFHILHTGGAENIADQVCINALKQVNSDYSRDGADTSQIFTPFKSLYIDSDIKLMLARKDPQGNCTSGIVRHYDVKTQWDQGAASAPSYWTYTWDPTKYLNVYVVANIIPQGTVTGGGIIVGYTYKPGTHPTGGSMDGIIYRYNFLNGLDARSLSHELGHWLNLAHTFGNTNNPGVTCGDDGIGDTPATKGNFATCPAASTNTTILCNSGITPYYQNVENIMDYSSCPKNFTSGQTTVMRNALASAVSGRSNLVSQSNLTTTDVNAVIPCAPIAEFLSTTDTYTVCSGGSLTMKDYSYNGAITTYQWAADLGAVAASPTASQTGMVFPTPGTCNVTLTVGNAQGTATKVRTVVVLNGQAPGSIPAVESFENQGIPPFWQVIDNDNGSSTWERTEDAAKHGVGSFYIAGGGTGPNQQDYLVLPLLNIANSTDKTISFAYAYAKASNTQNDVLKIQGSKDCGGTWNDILAFTSNSLATNSGGVDANPFIPLPSQWKTFTITTANTFAWSQYINSYSVLLRLNFIEGTTGGGNNIYVDAFGVAGPVGINELVKDINLNVYPNPTSSETTVSFELDDATQVKMNVVDIYGRTVLPVVNTQFAPGAQTLSINKDGKLAAGIYFIDLSINGAKVSRKLIIE